MNQPQTRWQDRARSGLTMARDFIQLLGRSFREDGCKESAAALTYTTLFAIVPIMTVAFAILSAIPALQERSGEIQQWAFANFAPGAGEKVLEYVNEFSRQAGNLTAIGAIFLFVTSVLMLRTIERNMNRIWRVTTPRSGPMSVIMYWAVLTLGPLSLGAALGISSYLTSMSLITDTVELLGGMRLWLSLLPLLFMTLALTLMYVVVPNCYVPVRQGLIGGFVAACLFELAKGGFTLFIKMSPSYEVVYGAFAAVPLFLLWLFISWNIVLGGAELVRVLVVFGEYRSELPRLQSLLRLLEILWRRQQQGRVLRVQEVRRVLKLAGASHWEEFRNLLMDLRLMRRTENGEFVLGRDLNTLTLTELVDMLPWTTREALRVGEQHNRPWEPLLASRCAEARGGWTAPLDMTVEQLFSSTEEKNETGRADPQ
jgi:membrane protein